MDKNRMLKVLIQFVCWLLVGIGGFTAVLLGLTTTFDIVAYFAGLQAFLSTVSL